MPINLRSVSASVQAAVCVLALTLGLAVAPALMNPAGASASGRSTASAECTSAQAAVKKAATNQAAARKAVAKAKAALKKAKKAKHHRAAKVKKAKKALAKANKRFAAAKKASSARATQAKKACAAPAPGKQATDTGKLLSLVPLGNGIDPGTLSASQLTTVLNELLPGVSGNLTPDQLTALLSGFNSGSSLDPTEATALLTGLLDPTSITSLLGGSASPADLSAVITGIISQLSGLSGGMPIPGSFDPTSLFETFAGMFGTLDPSQLGSLLELLQTAVGSGSATFSPTQLTALINSLVPGISDQFSPTQLTSMLGALNGQGLSADTLSNLLGGQFSPTQLLSVINGTAGQALLGSVINQVVAELGTAGGGNLALPGSLNAGQVANLISTVSNVLADVLGNVPVIPVVCGLIPIPGLCT